MAEFFDSPLMILCIIGSYAHFHNLLFKNASILGLVLLNLSYIMLSFSGRNQRASWREFLVTLKMMWSPLTLSAIAGINYGKSWKFILTQLLPFYVDNLTLLFIYLLTIFCLKKSLFQIKYFWCKGWNCIE